MVYVRMKSPNQAQTSVRDRDFRGNNQAGEGRPDQTRPDGTMRRNVNISTCLGLCRLCSLLWVDCDEEEIIRLSQGSVLSAGGESPALAL